MNEINTQNYYNVPNNDKEVVKPDMPVDTGAIVDPSGIEYLKQVTPLEQVNTGVTVTRYEAEYALAETEESLRQFCYYYLVRSVNRAEEAGADVSDIKARMPELRRKVALAEVYRALADTQKFLSQGYYNYLKNMVEAAKEAGVDVSDVEDQMPEILKRVTRKEAESALAQTEESLRQESYDYLLVYSVRRAKEAGADVSDIEAKMPELQKRVARKEAEYALAETKKFLIQFCYDYLVRSVNRAEEAGANVSDIKAQMPEIRRKVALAEVYRALADTKKFLSQGYYNYLKKMVETAKEAGVDVSGFEDLMPGLHKQVLLDEVSRALTYAQQYLTRGYYDYLEKSVEAARNAGIDVSYIETQMPILKERCVN